MQNVKRHSVYRIMALLLLIAVIIPTIVKFAHILEDHQHTVCTNKTSTHIHSVDLDCEFYKFKLNTSISMDFNYIDFLSVTNNHKIVTSEYQFASDFQRLPFLLRGPPRLV